jgi:hypothetical protein
VIAMPKLTAPGVPEWSLCRAAGPAHTLTWRLQSPAAALLLSILGRAFRGDQPAQPA